MVSTRQPHFAADELQAAIADQRAGQQAGFHQNLEAVADAEHQSAIGGELADGLHDGRELGDGAAAQIIAVGEAAGENDGIDIAERGRIVPDKLRLLPEIVGDRVERIVIAIAAGKNNDAEFHGFCFGEASTLFYQRRSGRTGHGDAGSAQFPWRILRGKLFLMRTCLACLAGIASASGRTALSAEADEIRGHLGGGSRRTRSSWY